jgi:SpoVK/Ycf46/Vps4 family AAA+-type ATPase
LHSLLSVGVVPGAKPGALDGPEPAKQWLTRCVVGPYKRNRTSSGAGYCYRGLLLGGPAGCGKTELAVAVAAGMGAGLLYVTPSELQDPKGHVLLRALFQSARNAAPCVLCLDDAHVAFPAQRHPDPEHPSHRLRTELMVQLEQLGEEQAALAKAALAGSSAKGGSVPAAKVRQWKLSNPPQDRAVQ